MIQTLSRLRVALSLAGLVVVVVALTQDDQRMMWVAIALLLGSVVARLLLRRAIAKAQADVTEE